MSFPDSNYQKGTAPAANSNKGSFTVPTGTTAKVSVDSSSMSLEEHFTGTAPDKE